MTRADAHIAVERAVGVLKHHLHIAPQRAKLPVRQVRDVPPGKFDRARRRLDHAQERAQKRRFAAAGFARDAERLTLVHGDVYTVYRLHEQLSAPRTNA